MCHRLDLRSRLHIAGPALNPADLLLTKLQIVELNRKDAIDMIALLLAHPLGADGIDAARAFIARCWFDAATTERGRLALVSYHKTWDEKRKCFGSHPFHDWSSNGADAFRYLAVGHKTTAPRPRKHEPTYRDSGGSGDYGWMGT